MKTAYVISNGLQMPDQFQWRGMPVILAQPGLWDAMKVVSSGLVFRVRTEQNVGDRLNGSDRIESAVGLIDSTTRWRACIALIQSALSGLRIPDVAEACWNVFGLMTTKHPASIQMSERQQLAASLRLVMDKLPEGDARAAYEGSVAGMCMRLAFAENDVEVAHIVPYVTAYMINAGEYSDDRQATVEVMASSVFLSESSKRLFEKFPEWVWGRLPATPSRTPAAKPPEPAGEPLEEDDEEAGA